jgi:thioredoxin-like negative regulator of GroEL
VLVRLAIAAAIVVVSLGGWALWRRPPRGVSRLDLRELGVSGPLILQFSTPYCAPCKRNAPMLERTAREASVSFAQIDLAERPELAARYGIRTVPTIVVATDDGRVLGTWTGLPQNGEIRHAALSAVGGA